MVETPDLTDGPMPHTIRSKLAAERIQQNLSREDIQPQLKPERIQALQAEVPGWSIGKNAGSLTRTYDFPTVRAAGLFIQLVAEVGDSMGYVPEVDLRSLAATVTVSTSQEDGLFELDFDVARILDNRL